MAGDENPFSAPASSLRSRKSLGVGDIIKVVASALLAVLMLPFIPFGIIGKLTFAFGVFFAILNYSRKLRMTKDVFNCPNCGRELASSAKICPRCETRF